MVATGGGSAHRSTLTVVFTDLVASTELRSRVGDSAADDLRREHDRLVAEAIETNRGRVVKHLGDGIMATFVGAADAVRAAIAVQQALERRNRLAAGGHPLMVRIGMSAGDVTVEDDDCFGTPVIEAARLCAAAGGGVVLVSEVVRLLGGDAVREQVVSVGPLELKGLPEPLPTYEVVWRTAMATSLPMPGLLTRAGRIFVGRDEEVQRLLRLWKEAETGERRIALLGGEPGIGKTRLAVEIAGHARDAGGVVLAGRCDEDLGVPYQPFVEALRHYVTVGRDLRLGRHAGELTRLVPDLPQLVSNLPAPLHSDPETERYRLFDAMAAWLADLSADAPVLLVLDDLHWAAKPTLLLLRHILRSTEPLRLLVVATYRDSDIGRGHPMTDFLADLRREAGVERVAIGGLDAAAVTAFIESAAGHELRGEEARRLPLVVWRETEGNPFFVAEVLRHLSEIGAIEQRSGSWVLSTAVEDLGVPEGVRDVVGRRLSRLTEATNRTLAAAAVLGLEFAPVLVERMVGVDEEHLCAVLEEATGARLLVEMLDGRYRFAHALIRATLYEELSAARRTALHRRAAETIEALHGDALDDWLPALAHHWARAAAPVADTDRAVDYAARAGDRALAQLAHDEAAGYYRQALELQEIGGAERVRERTELLIALGEAQRRAGDPTHRETLLEASRRATERGDADALSRAALANVRGMYASSLGEVDQERVAALEAALMATGDADTQVRARLLAALAQELTYAPDRERRVRLADEALAIARRCGDDATLADVHLQRFFAILPGDPGEARAVTDELLPLAERLGDPVITARALLLRFRTLAEAGEMDEADRCLGEAERLAGELGRPTLGWLVGLSVTARVLLAGDLDAGERCAHAGLELGQAAGQGDAAGFFATHLFLIRLEQGRLGELEDRIATIAAAQPDLPVAKAYLALLLCELDRPDEAAGYYRTLGANDFAGLPVDSTWLIAVTFCASVGAYLGDRAGTRTLYELATPYGGQIVVTSAGALGAMAHYLGMLAATFEDWDTAERWFTEADAMHERVGARIWLARTRLEWARMLLTRNGPGDATRARRLLDQALATARPGGLNTIVRRAEALLITVSRGA